jgi:hypothetical protein
MSFTILLWQTNKKSSRKNSNSDNSITNLPTQQIQNPINQKDLLGEMERVYWFLI